MSLFCSYTALAVLFLELRVGVEPAEAVGIAFQGSQTEPLVLRQWDKNKRIPAVRGVGIPCVVLMLVAGMVIVMVMPPCGG